MARYYGPSCRVCRRALTKLFLKGERCNTSKCALEKRKFPPGQRPKRSSKPTDYSVQLREKQKLKKMYGMLEAQFRRFFHLAQQRKGVTGDNLIELLERRFDNIIYRMHFAQSRKQSQQLIRHGHFLINKKKVSIPSYLVKAGDEITVKERSKKVYPILKSLGTIENIIIPPWLLVDVEKFTGKVLQIPKRTDIDIPVREQLVVELYSK